MDQTTVEGQPDEMATSNSAASYSESTNSTNDNAPINQALGPLIDEFKLLRESVDTVHKDYADLKKTIFKQKDELKYELVDKIDRNTAQMTEISSENKALRKENVELKNRLDRIEQNQLQNNVIITGIPEGPYEPYSTTKLRVQEMIATTIDSGDADSDLMKAKSINITSCTRIGKFRTNFARPITVTFSTRDDKESFLACKWKLPAGVFANEELPLHIKKRRDRLMPIYKLAKSLPQYREKCRLHQDKLIINGSSYRIEDIPNLPTDLAAYKAVEKANETHLVFAGEWSPYSNFHSSPFIVNGQRFHSGEQWVQYQKALLFGDSYTANQILQCDTPLECKRLSYNINGVDRDKWLNEGYEICLDGIRAKFSQNPPLLSMLRTTSPKILAEATTDRLWGTGVKLRDTQALNTEKWSGPGWLSRMLISIREDNNF